MQMQPAAFMQGVSGLQLFVQKRYQSMKLRVANATTRYSFGEILVHLRGIAYLSHIFPLLFLMFSHDDLFHCIFGAKVTT